MSNYKNSDIIQGSVNKKTKTKYTYARLKDSKFAVVKKRFLSYFFKNKYILLLDGYVNLPFVYDTKKEVKEYLSIK